MNSILNEALANVSLLSNNNSQGLLSMFPVIILLIIFMYLFIVRPQTKKIKDHKYLIDSLQKGDEIVTVGGVLGKIEKIADDLIMVNIADNVNVIIQKKAISHIIPRGTMKTI